MSYGNKNIKSNLNIYNLSKIDLGYNTNEKISMDTKQLFIGGSIRLNEDYIYVVEGYEGNYTINYKDNGYGDPVLNSVNKVISIENKYPTFKSYEDTEGKDLNTDDIYVDVLLEMESGEYVNIYYTLKNWVNYLKTLNIGTTKIDYKSKLGDIYQKVKEEINRYIDGLKAKGYNYQIGIINNTALMYGSNGIKIYEDLLNDFLMEYESNLGRLCNTELKSGILLYKVKKDKVQVPSKNYDEFSIKNIQEIDNDNSEISICLGEFEVYVSKYEMGKVIKEKDTRYIVYDNVNLQAITSVSADYVLDNLTILSKDSIETNYVYLTLGYNYSNGLLNKFIKNVQELINDNMGKGWGSISKNIMDFSTIEEELKYLIKDFIDDEIQSYYSSYKVKTSDMLASLLDEFGVVGYIDDDEQALYIQGYNDEIKNIVNNLNSFNEIVSDDYELYYNYYNSKDRDINYVGEWVNILEGESDIEVNNKEWKIYLNKNI